MIDVHDIESGALSRIRKTRLEEQLIGLIAQQQNLSELDALDVYYNSAISDKIYNGEYGIQYLDANYIYQEYFLAKTTQKPCSAKASTLIQNS